MNEIAIFIAGSVLAAAWVGIGFVVGFQIRDKMTMASVAELKRQFMRPSKDSGAVRPYTKAELEHKADKGAKRTEEVIEDLGGGS